MPAVAHEQLRDRYAQSCRQVFSSKFDQLLGWGSTASPLILEIMLTTDRKIITGTGIITALLSRLRLCEVICVSYKADRSRSLSFGDLGHQLLRNIPQIAPGYTRKGFGLRLGESNSSGSYLETSLV